MTKKRIIVVDDEPLISILMKEVIEENPEFEVSQMTTEKSEFLNLMKQYPFHAAVIDISIGGKEGGLELLKIMKDQLMNTPVIVLSAHDELYYALKCLQAGAKGYINKRYICTDVIRCLNEVFTGNLFVSGDRGKDILKQYQKLDSPVAA